MKAIYSIKLYLNGTLYADYGTNNPYQANDKYNEIKESLTEYGNDAYLYLCKRGEIIKGATAETVEILKQLSE